jgi:hypothetical protein
MPSFEDEIWKYMMAVEELRRLLWRLGLDQKGSFSFNDNQIYVLRNKKR